ncbi:hypothetical protein LINPERHAP1_LOCUS21883, partial [Linum perenne]
MSYTCCGFSLIINRLEGDYHVLKNIIYFCRGFG